MSNKIIKALVLGLLVIGISVAVMYRDQLDAAALESWVSNAGAAAPLLFMLIYIIGTVFFFPGSVLTLAGGALFGPYWGTLYNLTAATLGAIISFVAARYLASDWVEKKTGGRLKSLKEGVENEGWKFVAFVRLVPLFPFNILNYALGLTRIKLSHYSLATYICMLPGAIAYTYVGYVGREALAGDEAIIQKAMLALALLAIVGFLPSLIKRLKSQPMISVDAIKQQLDENEDLLILDVRNQTDYHGEQGHIAASTLIPLEELSSRLHELAEHKDKNIVTICRTDKRSAKAARLLADAGFTHVQVVHMGMTNWNAKHFPVEH